MAYNFITFAQLQDFPSCTFIAILVQVSVCKVSTLSALHIEAAVTLPTLHSSLLVLMPSWLLQDAVHRSSAEDCSVYRPVYQGSDVGVADPTVVGVPVDVHCLFRRVWRTQQ